MVIGACASVLGSIQIFLVGHVPIFHFSLLHYMVSAIRYISNIPIYFFQLMEHSPVSLKALKYTVICAFTFATFVILKPYLFPRTYITICDVGQGDAIYLHQSDGFDILVDTGPDSHT